MGYANKSDTGTFTYVHPISASYLKVIVKSSLGGNMFEFQGLDKVGIIECRAHIGVCILSFIFDELDFDSRS